MAEVSPRSSLPCSPTRRISSRLSVTTSSAGARRAELEARGVHVHAAADRRPQRWAFAHVDEVGERTITTVGPKLRPLGSDDRLPWPELAGMDAVLFIAGDVEALRLARRAPVLTATARDLDILRRGGVELDALIGSGEDEAERYHAASSIRSRISS